MKAFVTGAVIGTVLGYVQGAKAGIDRYQQIKTKTDKFASLPIVQKAVKPVKPALQGRKEAGREMMTTVMTKAAGVKDGVHVGH